MKSIEFKEQNVIFAKDQEEYANLPAFAQQNGMVTFCMELKEEELKSVIENGRAKITVLNFNRPVQSIRVAVDKPEFPVDIKIRTLSNPESWSEEGTATFSWKLSLRETAELKKTKCLWITTVTHGSPLQPISRTIN